MIETHLPFFLKITIQYIVRPRINCEGRGFEFQTSGTLFCQVRGPRDLSNFRDCEHEASPLWWALGWKMRRLKKWRSCKVQCFEGYLTNLMTFCRKKSDGIVRWPPGSTSYAVPGTGGPFGRALSRYFRFILYYCSRRFKWHSKNEVQLNFYGFQPSFFICWTRQSNATVLNDLENRLDQLEVTAIHMISSSFAGLATRSTWHRASN